MLASSCAALMSWAPTSFPPPPPTLSSEEEEEEEEAGAGAVKVAPVWELVGEAELLRRRSPVEALAAEGAPSSTAGAVGVSPPSSPPPAAVAVAVAVAAAAPFLCFFLRVELVVASDWLLRRFLGKRESRHFTLVAI